MDDGWEDDDDLALLDVDSEKEQLFHRHEDGDAAGAGAHPLMNTTQPQRQTSLPDNAWEEDEDLLDLEEEEEEEETGDQQPRAFDEGDWNQHDDRAASRPAYYDNTHWSDDSHYPDQHPPAADKGSHIQESSFAVTESALKYELYAYVESLPTLAAAVNATLEREYNTLDKANELIDYYAARHQLVQYTIQTELSRMEYRLTDTDGRTWSTSSTAVSNRLPEFASRLERAAAQDSLYSLLIRSANQSLLADPLQVITGTNNTSSSHTALVRHEYLATCVADHVTISINLSAPSMVQLQAQLNVLVPTHQERRTIARIHLNVAFGPSADPEPMIEFRLAHVELADDWQDALEPWAALLMEQQHGHGNDELSSIMQDDYEDVGNFRDAFVQHSQVLLQSSAMGMQSAWNEVQAATGLKNKLPAFLPDDVLQQAHDEEQSHFQQQASSQQQQYRPTSILGGLVKKGWTQLAKSVALPDEDEAIYQAWQPPSQHSSFSSSPTAPANLKLYRPKESGVTAQNSVPQNPFRRDATVAAYRNDSEQEIKHTSPPSLSLYRKDEDEEQLRPGHLPAAKSDTPFAQTHQSPLQLYRIPNEPKHRRPQLYNMEEPSASLEQEYEHGVSKDVVADGWDDDDVALDDDEDDDNVLEASKMDSISVSTSNELAGEAPFGFVAVNWDYDPVTDIRPTRKRWINPIPGPRRLQLMKG